MARRVADLGIDGYDDPVVVGIGGFATVYRARQPGFNRTVAIKLLNERGVDEEAMRRFARERAAMGLLGSHPNVVTVYDAGVSAAGTPYLVMEYVGGGSLADRVENRGPMAPGEVAAIGVKVGGALETAHRLGVLHRDVKPENVMLSEFDEPKLTDFGIAWVFGGPETQSRQVQLSVLHSAPEVMSGGSATERSDVYSLASTLYALLTGRAPFEGDRHESIQHFLVRLATQPPSDLRLLGVPGPIATVIERGLSKDPDTRPSSALLFADLLRHAQGELGLAPTPVPVAGRPTAVVSPPADVATPQRPSRGRRRQRAFVAGVAAWAVAAVAVVLAVMSGGHGASHAGSPAVTTAPVAPTTTGVASVFPVRGRLSPGSYKTSAFRPTFRIVLDDGWFLTTPETAEKVDLGLGAATATGPGILILHTEHVVSAAAAPTSIDGARAAEVELPGDLPGWLNTHPRLHAYGAVPTQIAGINMIQVDYEVANPYSYNKCGMRPCVVLFPAGADTVIASFADDRTRAYVLPRKNSDLVILVSAPADRFAEFVTRAQGIIDTIEFTGT